jgi:hypothetical protein
MDHHTMAVFPSFSINCFVPFSPWLSYGCNMLQSLPVYKCLQYFTIHIKYINTCSTVLLFCHDFPWRTSFRALASRRRGAPSMTLDSKRKRRPRFRAKAFSLNGLNGLNGHDFGGFLADECRKHWKHWKHGTVKLSMALSFLLTIWEDHIRAPSCRSPWDVQLSFGSYNGLPSWAHTWYKTLRFASYKQDFKTNLGGRRTWTWTENIYCKWLTCNSLRNLRPGVDDES